jgi:glycerol-3-phosphate dehydrogenase
MLRRSRRGLLDASARTAGLKLGETFDLLVIGGGINGVGIARDAAGRGLSVALCEKGDLASATSSASSKMVHGGLRYLEHGAFRLVRESLAEREVLLRTAPHLVRPLRFVLPHGAGQRPRWMLRIGLFLYDRLGGARSLRASAAVDLRDGAFGAPLKESVRDGFVYSDCVVDDARLTVANARDAARHGATILTRSAFTVGRRDGAVWRATLVAENGTRSEVAARILVNAAGPWAEEARRLAGLSGRARLRLVKGSHIVAPELYPGDHAYLLQNDDRRIVFVMPFEREYSLIGTTELAFAGDPAGTQITTEEILYLCRAVARWFEAPPRPEDVVWSYAGVRPLYEDRARDAASVSRDYVFDLDTTGAPALSVFGGKLTTHRRLAEHALEKLKPYLPEAGPPWTAGSVLPGGDGLPAGGVAALAAELSRRHPFLAGATAVRLARSYGSDACRILCDATSPAALGRAFGQGLSESELRWLVEREWACTTDDVLWRRTKLGLSATPEEVQELADYFRDHRPLAALQGGEGGARAGGVGG